MKSCKLCGKYIPARVKLGDKVVNTQRRKYCYDCSPFGSGNSTLLKGNKTPDEKQEIVNVRKKKRSKVVSNFLKKQRQSRKEKLVNLFGGKCSKCGYMKCLQALDFHHVNKEDKLFSLSTLGYTCAWERLMEEARKCVILCANCHREAENGVNDGIT
jgi:predicted Zn-ribbon and HTH transcriptional regulator